MKGLTPIVNREESSQGGTVLDNLHAATLFFNSIQIFNEGNRKSLGGSHVTSVYPTLVHRWLYDQGGLTFFVVFLVSFMNKCICSIKW